MKKIFFALFSFVALFLASSCSNDDIAIQQVGRKYSLALNVNTQKMYDEFGLTRSIREDYLRDGIGSICLMTYIYDANGNLVISKKTLLNNHNLVNLSFDLVEGHYTIVNIETLVFADENNKPDAWSIDGSEKLSTLKITQKKGEPDENGYRWTIMAYASEVIGVSTKEVQINNPTVLEVIPDAIGSVIIFNHYYSDKTMFVTVGWATDDVLNYYSLNPSLNRDDRFIKSLTDKGKTYVRELRDVTDNKKYYGAYVLESEMDWQIVYQDQDRQENGVVGIYSQVHANLEDGKTYQMGCFFGNEYVHYGLFSDIDELLNWKHNLDRTDSPDSNVLFEEPYTDWGTTVASVKSFMSGYRAYNNGNLEEINGSYVLTYYGIYKEDQIRYWFTSETGGLTDAVVFFDSEKVGEDDLSKAFMEMEYTFLYSSDGSSLYKTKDGMSHVLVGLNDNNEWYVIYSSASSTSAPRRSVKKELSKFDNKQQNVISSINFDKTYVIGGLRQCEDSMKKFYFK